MAFNYIVYGKAVMLTKNYVKLEMLTESFEEYFSIFSNQLGFIHNSIFKAVAKYNLYGMEKGVSELQEALSKARQDYIIAPFVENALYIISMLETILNNNSRDEYINKTTVLSRQYIENLQNSSENKINLSQRELEVLSLTAKGLKRTQVACKLGISESTAKTHLQNIYKKLQVSGKFEAVKIARMYGII